MSNCEYKPVQNDSKQPRSQEAKIVSWKPFLRQLRICSCVWSMYFQFGLCVGAPTVIIPRMRDEQGQLYVTRDMSSWISSAMPYSSLPFTAVVVVLASVIGRRYTFTLGVLSSIMGFAVLCAGETPLQVLAGMIVQGPLASCIMTISLLVVTEYTSPVYRGVFLTIKSATIFWGIWVANAIGTVAHWHYIAWLGLACAMYNLVNLFSWPESPYWLAGKGRLEQCRKTHQWLKGHDTSSNKELEELIKGQQLACDEEGKLDEDTLKEPCFKKWRQIWLDMKSKHFYKSLLFNIILVTQYTFTGKIVISVYAIDIIRGITNSKDDAYNGMLVLDGVTVLGMYIGCGLSKKFSRRMLLISAGGAGSIFLLIMSIYLFLVRTEVMSENKYITLSLLTCFSLSVSCGPIILNSGLGAELLPLRLRGTATAIVAIVSHIVLGTVLKVSPYIFAFIGMDSAFLFYGIMSGIFLVILYMYLPETKDKTLQQIQDLIIGTKCKSEPKEMKLYKFGSTGTVSVGIQ